MDTPNNNQPIRPQTTGNDSVNPPIADAPISYEDDTKNMRRQTAAEDELAQALAEERKHPHTTQPSPHAKPAEPAASPTPTPAPKQTRPPEHTASDSKFFAIPQKQTPGEHVATRPGMIPQKTNDALPPKTDIKLSRPDDVEKPQPEQPVESESKPATPPKPEQPDTAKQMPNNPLTQPESKETDEPKKKAPLPSKQPFTPHPKLKTLRTFRSDMAGLVRDNGESVTSIAVAAQKKKDEKEKVVPTPVTIPTKKETPEPLPVPHKPDPKPIPKPAVHPHTAMFQKPVTHPAPKPHIEKAPEPLPKKEPPQAPLSRHATMPAITRTNPANNESVSVKSATSIPFFKNTLLILVSVALVGFGGFTLYSTFFVQQTVNKPVALTQPETLIAYDTYTTIPFDVRETLIQSIQSTQQELPPSTGAITYTHIEVSPEDLFTRLTPQIPQVLSRILQNPYAIGYYQDGEQRILFMAVTVESYGQALAGMLSWEPTLYREISALHGQTPVEVRTGFVDTVIENKDARKLTTQAGDTLVVYGFIDNNTLIITENEAVFRGVANNILIKRSTR